MGAGRTKTQNFWKTTLSGLVTATDLAYPLSAIDGATSPTYIVINPTSGTLREVILADGVFSDNTMRSTALAKRALQGTVNGVAQEHPVGSEVWIAPLGMHFDDLWDAVEAAQATADAAQADADAALVLSAAALPKAGGTMDGALDMGGNAIRNAPVEVNTQAGSYTLVLADAGKVVELNSASAVNLTVPPNSAVTFPIGTLIEVWAMGAGAVTLMAGAGVTLRTPETLVLDGQYATAALRKRAADEWAVEGRLVAA